MNLEVKDFYIRSSKLNEFLKYKQQLGWKVISVNESANNTRGNYVRQMAEAGAKPEEIDKGLQELEFSIKTKVTLQRDKDDSFCKKMKETDENIDKLNKAIDDEEERVFKAQNSFGRNASKGSIGLVCGVISIFSFVVGAISLMLAIAGVSVVANVIAGVIAIAIGVSANILKKYLQNKITNKKVDSNLNELKSKLQEIYNLLNDLEK